MSNYSYKILSEATEILMEAQSVPASTERAMPEVSAPSHIADEVTESVDEARMSEVLGRVRIAVKYLCFDLEATRRENHALRTLLREHMGSDRDSAE